MKKLAIIIMLISSAEVVLSLFTSECNYQNVNSFQGLANFLDLNIFKVVLSYHVALYAFASN